VARKFLYGKPHLFKETCKAAGCVLAFALALIGYFRGSDGFDVAAYVVLIAALYKWRMDMFNEMEGR
jgi:hypothetical protein